VLLKSAGELQVRELRLSEISGEPGAIYYGYVRDNKRYMSVVPMLSVPVVEHDDDSGIGEEQPRGIDEVDGRESRLSQNSEPRIHINQEVGLPATGGIPSNQLALEEFLNDDNEFNFN